MIEQYLFALIPFVILPALVLALAGTTNPVQRGCAAAVVMLVLWSLFGDSPWLLLQAFLTLTVGLVYLSLNVRPSTLVLTSAAITAITFGFSVTSNYKAIQSFLALRAEYPLVSLADRLAYESESGPSRHVLANATSSEAVESQLQTWELQGTHRRSRDLLRLHSRSYAGFVMANGFGNSRMSRLHKEFFSLPDAGPVSLPPHPYPSPEMKTRDQVPMVGDDQIPIPYQPPSGTTLRATYTAGITQFLDSNRMGYVIDLDHVAGFQPHGFRPGPEIASATAAPAGWHVARLELVSLLKHETPVAYVSEYLPRMDELQRSPTRPLDEFERASLERIWNQEDLVIDERPDRIRMLGAVRAANQCLTCHSVQRAQLLGAFSYELLPVRPAIQVAPKPRT